MHFSSDEEKPDATITALLEKAKREGGEEFAIELLDRTYQELKNIARQVIRGERIDHTLGATGVLHESLIRLGQPKGLTGIEDKQQLLAAATRLMQNILTDYARMRGTKKRGGGAARIQLDEAIDRATKSNEFEFLHLKMALEELQQFREKAHTVVMNRIFGGMTIAEVADLMNVSTTTVENEWKFAKAWLREKIESVQ